MSVTVREARQDELEAAGAVVADAYEFDYGDEHSDYLDAIRDARGRARRCTILVAVDADDRILGCVTYVPDHRNPWAETEREGEAGFRMLGVDPAERGRGIGAALVQACIATARVAGRRAVAITSTSEMHAAHRLYVRLGFMRDPGRDFVPVPGVQLWAYVLALDPP